MEESFPIEGSTRRRTMILEWDSDYEIGFSFTPSDSSIDNKRTSLSASSHSSPSTIQEFPHALLLLVTMTSLVSFDQIRNRGTLSYRSRNLCETPLGLPDHLQW